MIYLLYISCFFLSGLILFLFQKDLYTYKKILYDRIDLSIWIKSYAILTIGYIHLVTICNILFWDEKDIYMCYGLSPFLLIPYIIYLVSITIKEKEETYISIQIHKYINLAISLYIFCIISIICIPYLYKKKITLSTKDFIHRNFLSKK